MLIVWLLISLSAIGGYLLGVFMSAGGDDE